MKVIRKTICAEIDCYKETGPTFHSRFIRSNRGAFDANVILFDGVGSLDRHLNEGIKKKNYESEEHAQSLNLVVRCIAVLNAQVKIFDW
jgi:hypothetical protein